MGIYSEILLGHTDIQSRLCHSKQFLRQVRDTFSTLPSSRREDICVFAAGSLGRFETGKISDLDVFILADRPNRSSDETSISASCDDELRHDLEVLITSLGLPPFSGYGKYLRIHELSDLISATGDPSDDKENWFTTRLLLLLESQPISNDHLYQRAMQRVLENYYRDGKGRKDFRPLFLLNDVLRYWRTLCLNYERDRALEKPWWKKNLNLKFSRKLTVFSTALAIVSNELNDVDQFKSFSKKVPLERLATVLDKIDDQSLADRFKDVLSDYESFLAAKSYSELETKNIGKIDQFRAKADVFGNFIYDALTSPKLDRSLAKYLTI